MLHPLLLSKHTCVLLRRFRFTSSSIPRSIDNVDAADTIFIISERYSALIANLISRLSTHTQRQTTDSDSRVRSFVRSLFLKRRYKLFAHMCHESNRIELNSACCWWWGCSSEWKSVVNPPIDELANQIKLFHDVFERFLFCDESIDSISIVSIKSSFFHRLTRVTALRALKKHALVCTTREWHILAHI